MSEEKRMIARLRLRSSHQKKGKVGWKNVVICRNGGEGMRMVKQLTNDKGEEISWTVTGHKEPDRRENSSN